MYSMEQSLCRGVNYQYVINVECVMLSIQCLAESVEITVVDISTEFVIEDTTRQHSAC